jgi:NADPH:quinone reductase-like Zn-dependent oxidoreductase
MAGGGHAQYACVREDGAVALKSDSLNWEQAVAIPFGANTALYFLRDLGKIQAGQELLIIGASGSIGSAGVQLAKHCGALVTAVCSGANVDLVKSQGADRVIDYTKEDFTSRADAYDLIFDIVGATSFRRCRHALKPRGIFLQNIMGLSGMVGILWTSMVGGKQLRGGVAMDSPARMNVIAELVAAGKLRPVIDRSFPLERIAEAFKYVEQGHKKGNVVITVASMMAIVATVSATRPAHSQGRCQQRRRLFLERNRVGCRRLRWVMLTPPSTSVLLAPRHAINCVE